MRKFLRYCLFTSLILVSGLASAPALADAPSFVSGNGITVYRTTWVSNRTMVVDISTPSIAPQTINGAHQIRITLPATYYNNTGTRFPVLYLLHGGAGGHSSQWTAGGGDAENLTRNQPLITVMPDGGKVGWYTNWVNNSAGVQKWEEFHLYQLIPWVDANLRTIARKEGRAIAGLSMGGFGAIHYAQQRPDLFAYAASFSGALNLGDAGIRSVVTEQAAQNGMPIDGPFGWPTWPLDGVWNANNPINRADRLRTVKVALYAGSGIHDADVLERTVGWSSHQMHNALDAARIPHFWLMYGRPGNTVPYGCDGGHNFSCWNYALMDVLPRMMGVLWHP
ncbi:MAG: alpha/beta hydrolase [Pseudomonadota bacterium]